MGLLNKQQRSNISTYWAFEKNLIGDFNGPVGGVDEVGRGPLAGPVAAGAVILPTDFSHPLIRDSKLLDKRRLKQAYDLIVSVALAWHVAFVDEATIDKINIKNAAKLAMENAIAGLKIQPLHVLVDFEKINVPMSQTSVVKGDAKCISIAAAAILAKVERDKLMLTLHAEYPQYGFDTNCGYGTAKHLQALAKWGPTVIHRKTFSPVKKAIANLQTK